MKHRAPTAPPRTPAVILLVALAAMAPANAQVFTTHQRSNDPVDLEFDFSNPGARSLAMGGAVAAFADDATAAYSNPAGLVQLPRPEGHGASSFLSVAWPFRDTTIAVYRHVLADSGGAFADFRPAENRRVLRSDVDLDVVGTGVALGRRVSERLSIGAAVVGYDFRFRSDTLTERTSRIDPEAPLEHELGSLEQQGRKTTLRVNLGIHYRPGTRWALAAYYRQGPTVDLEETRIEDLVGDQPLRETSPAGTFRAPPVYGIALASRPSIYWRVAAEIDVVRYSTVLPEELRRVERRVTPWSEETELLGFFELDDAVELRLGAERIFWNLPGQPRLRFGAWLDPDHSLGFRPAPGREGDLSAVHLTTRYRGRGDLVHISLGAGVQLFERVQLDAAVDLAEHRRVTSVSMVTQF